MDEHTYQKAMKRVGDRLSISSDDAANHAMIQGWLWLASKGIYQMKPDGRGGLIFEVGPVVRELAQKDSISLDEACQRLARKLALEHEQAHPDFWKGL